MGPGGEGCFLALSKQGVSSEILQTVSVQFLFLHPAILEPDFDLPVSEVEHPRELESFLFVYVHVKEKLAFQFADLVLGVGTALFPGPLGGYCKAKRPRGERGRRLPTSAQPPAQALAGARPRPCGDVPPRLPLKGRPASRGDDIWAGTGERAGEAVCSHPDTPPAWHRGGWGSRARRLPRWNPPGEERARAGEVPASRQPRAPAGGLDKVQCEDQHPHPPPAPPPP